MPELIIGGIALAPIIAALVQVFKRVGLPSQYAPYANVVLSALAAIAVLFVSGHPEYLPSVTLALQVLVLFLSTAGFYTTAKWAVGK
jgi:hypothetical protein